MRAREFLIERQQPAEANVSSLKAQLAGKIKELPTDAASMRLLHEIEDLLNTVGAASRSEYVDDQLTQINDPDVNSARKLIARFVLSLEANPKDRQALMTAWKADKLVNIKKMLTPGQHTISDLIIGYDSNPAIKEITDGLAGVADYGLGKGEFLLSVFSKKISKASKGDLLIKGVGTLEVKTQDARAARFGDQQVRVTNQYIPAVNKFTEVFNDEITQLNVNTKTGINIDNLSRIYDTSDTKKRTQFKKILNTVIANIFPKSPEYVGAIVDNIMAGNVSQAKQKYAQAGLNNYIAQKDDVGILYFNLSNDPFTVTFFNDNQSLNQGGLRLHISTAYPISTDPQRAAYPQTAITQTSRPEEQ
jgi:hypothetical protein